MATTDYTLEIWGQIETAVRSAERNLGRGVFPVDVMPRLPYARAEGSLRRDMASMWRHGQLVRIGGEDARQGYRVPTRMERVAWRCNGGRWPVHADRAMRGLRVV